MHKLATNIAGYLIDNGAARKDMREEYIYGLEIFGLKCLNYGSILMMAVMLNLLIPTMFFLFCFLPLRGRTGGFHAKTAMQCYAGTLGIYMIVSKLVVPFIVDNHFVLILMVLVSNLIIIILAPLNHRNLQLSEEELSSCKKSTRILLLLIMGGLGAAYYIQINTVCIAFAVCGIALDAVLLFIQKIIEKERTT